MVEKHNEYKRKERPGFAAAIEFARKHPTDHVDFTGDFCEIGRMDELSDAEHEELLGHLRAFIPWRKGPFRIFGHDLEASWKSGRKWDRVRRYMDDLKDARVADVGANNGYYMFRMLPHGPREVVGMDPVPLCYRNFEFLHALYPHPALRFVGEGFDHLKGYEDYFDVIFCMGIVYHHTDPLGLLQILKRALKKGGQVVFETMGFLPGGLPASDYRLLYEEGLPLRTVGSPLVLFPEGKYAGANGIWFLPSPDALVNWFRRSGFREVLLQEVHTYRDEQQKTEYSSMPDLVDFLKPEDQRYTIEGYPAPVRIHLSARK